MTEIDEAVFEFNLPKRPEAGADASAERYRFPLPLAEGEQGEYWIYEPSVEQITLFARANSRVASDADKLYAGFEFLQHVTDSDSFSYIRDRFVDPADAFGVETLADLIGSIVKHFQHRNASNRAERRAVTKR